MKAIHPCLPSCLQPGSIYQQPGTARPFVLPTRMWLKPHSAGDDGAGDDGAGDVRAGDDGDGDVRVGDVRDGDVGVGAISAGAALCAGLPQHTAPFRLQKEWFWCSSSAHGIPRAVCQAIHDGIILCNAGSSRPCPQPRSSSPAISIHCNSFHLLPGREMKTRRSPQRGVPHGEPQLFNHFLAPPWQRAAPPPPRQEQRY